jgi:hypothetical protein
MPPLGVAAVLVLAVGCLTLLGPSVLASAGSPAGATNCPRPTWPPNHPYQLAFSGSLSGHLSLTSTPVGAITFPPITGTFCGLLELPSEAAIVQPANLRFAPIDVSFARAIVPAAVEATAPSIGTVADHAATGGGLNLQLTAPIAARTGLLGVECLLPVQLTLSTAGPGGEALSGPLSSATATLVASGFAIGSAQSTGAGGTCPGYLAEHVDSLLGLPNSHTSTSVQVRLDISLQQ